MQTWPQESRRCWRAVDARKLQNSSRQQASERIAPWAEAKLWSELFGPAKRIGIELSPGKRPEPIETGPQPHHFTDDNNCRCFRQSRSCGEFAQSPDQHLLRRRAGFAPIVAGSSGCRPPAIKCSTIGVRRLSAMYSTITGEPSDRLPI